MKHKIISYDNGLEYVHIPSKSDMVSIGFIVRVDHVMKHLLIMVFLIFGTYVIQRNKKRNTTKLLSELDKLGTSYMQ